MKNRIFYTLSLTCCFLMCGCGNKAEKASIDVNTEGFYTTVNETKSNIEYAKKYENYILEMYLDKNVAELERSFLGIFDEGDTDSSSSEEKTEPRALGEYSGLGDYLIYSSAEAERYYKSVGFDSDNIEKYNEKDIEKFTEVAKSLCTVDIQYYLSSKDEGCFTQVFTIQDVKTRNHYIYLKWRGNKCEEIRYDYYEYLW